MEKDIKLFWWIPYLLMSLSYGQFWRIRSCDDRFWWSDDRIAGHPFNFNLTTIVVRFPPFEGNPRSNTLSDSGFHAVDSEFQVQDSWLLSLKLKFRIPIISGIPDSLNCILNSKAQDFGFQAKISWISESGPPKWDECDDGGPRNLPKNALHVQSFCFA